MRAWIQTMVRSEDLIRKIPVVIATQHVDSVTRHVLITNEANEAHGCMDCEKRGG